MSTSSSGRRRSSTGLPGVVRDLTHKQTLFTVEERVAFLEDALSSCENVVVDVFSELVVDFARRHDAKTMVKGLRVTSDFEWEFQMNHLNRQLAPEIETVYDGEPAFSFVSERRQGDRHVRGRVDELVPAKVARRFTELYPDGRPGAPVSPPSRLFDPWTYSYSSTGSTTSCTTRRPYLTDQVRLDREEIYEILDQMRATIPEEIKQGPLDRQGAAGDARRGEAGVRSDHPGGARAGDARGLQTEIVKLAENQAEDIVDDARRKACETRLEMEDWADSILSTLEVNLDKFLTAVKRGRERLHERSQETVIAGIGPDPIEPEEYERFS